MGVVVADTSDATAVQADAGARLGVLANQLPTADDVPPADAEAAALMANEAVAAATAPCAPSGKSNLTPAVVDPGAMSTVAVVAPGNCASIADCTVDASVAQSGLANVIWVVTAVGIAAADASDVTAGDADAADREVLANGTAIAVLMAVDAAAAAASPVGPGGNVRLTPAVEDPGGTSTTAAVAVGYCASITD